MSDILQRILAAKRTEVGNALERMPLQTLEAAAAKRGDVRDFAGALRERIARGQPAVIAEIKKASPSKGVLRDDYDPGAIAGSYAKGGAACLSVLTDSQFFQGAAEHLDLARQASGLPVLRKDFIVDAYQIAESRSLGADAILLIVAALTDQALAEFTEKAQSFGMAVLVEIHDELELERALALPTALIGINNRNLRTFETALDTTLQLAPRVSPDRIVIAESGIANAADIAKLRGAGVNAFLIGESLMRARDPGSELARLLA